MNRQHNYHRTAKRTRRGFALLIVMLIAAIVTVISIGLFNTLRVELAETQATKSNRQATWAARAGVEMAEAILLQNPDDPTTELNFEFPANSGRVVHTAISYDTASDSFTIQSSALVDGCPASATTSFSKTDLLKRASQMR